MKTTEQEIQYALEIARGGGAFPQWSKTLEALVADHRAMESLLKRAYPKIVLAAIPGSACDHRAARARLLQNHIEGFFGMPTCQKCGDPLRHDDDGPTLCRFCDQAHPETGGQAQDQVQ